MNERAALERCGPRRANVAFLNKNAEGEKWVLRTVLKIVIFYGVLSHMNIMI